MKRATRILRIVMLIVGLVCIVVFPPWNGILAWVTPLPDTVQQQVDAAVGHGIDGIIVHVDQAGAAPRSYSAGWKDRVHRVPADPEALFKIASISKLYIAVAATKLVSSRRLSLDDTIADHLPQLRDLLQHPERITVRMLLQHRSGIPSYTDHPEFDWADPPTTLDQQLGMIRGAAAVFEPGDDHQYSNTNYLLIGMILDQVLGYSHRRYIREEILAPLGLNLTYGSIREVDLDEVVSGYHHPHDMDFKAVEYLSPGGAMVSTAREVGVFLRALNDGSLLSGDEGDVYASVYEFGHKGWLVGYQSIARYHPDIDAVVVQFVNTTGGDSELVTTVVYDRIVRILREKQAITTDGRG